MEGLCQVQLETSFDLIWLSKERACVIVQRLISSAEPQKGGQTVLLCLYLIAKSMVTSEDFLTSGPFGLMTRSFLLFLPEIGSVLSFKESGMDEFLSVNNLLTVLLHYSSGQ